MNNEQELFSTTFTYQQAKNIVHKHGVLMCEFLSEVGDKDSYTGEEIYTWLGY